MQYLDNDKLLYILESCLTRSLHYGVKEINMNILISLIKQLKFSKEALSILVYYLSNECSQYSGMPAIEELNIAEPDLREQGYRYNCIKDVNKIIDLIKWRKKELYIYYSRVTENKLLELVKF